MSVKYIMLFYFMLFYVLFMCLLIYRFLYITAIIYIYMVLYIYIIISYHDISYHIILCIYIYSTMWVCGIRRNAPLTQPGNESAAPLDPSESPGSSTSQDKKRSRFAILFISCYIILYLWYVILINDHRIMYLLVVEWGEPSIVRVINQPVEKEHSANRLELSHQHLPSEVITSGYV